MSARPPPRPGWPLLAAALSFAALILAMPHAGPFFAALFPGLDRPLYAEGHLAGLVVDHLALVAASSGGAALLGMAAGILATRAWGAEFRTLVESLAAMGQTIPPVAVLALAVPAIGFGQAPALLALGLYAILPIVANTIAGLAAVAPEVKEAARGMGMGAWTVLVRVELPLAAPVILSGIRVSVMINLGTAAIASTVGARTLGLPIILGLDGGNTAYVLQGALTLAALAVLLDLAFDRVAGALFSRP
jgi:osmoprotectant transport system permease protein